MPTREPDLLMTGYTYQLCFPQRRRFTAASHPPPLKGGGPAATPGLCGQLTVVLLFSGATGQTNWLELEPFSCLLCLFVYDKLSGGVCKVNVWILPRYLINL